MNTILRWLKDMKPASAKNKGRLLVRKSGTENKIRIMVESLDKNLINKIIYNIKRSITS